MSDYDDGWKMAGALLDEGTSRDEVARECGSYAADSFDSQEQIQEFGTGALDRLHDLPHREQPA